MQFFLNIPYEKYLLFVEQIIDYLLVRLAHVFNNLLNWTKHCASCLLLARFYLISYYIILFLWFYVSLLPFFVLAIPMKYFDFVSAWYYFCLVAQGLASFHAFYFSYLKNWEPFHTTETKIIEPQKIMSVVPLLVQNRKEWVLKFCKGFTSMYLIYVVAIPFTLPVALTDVFLDKK